MHGVWNLVEDVHHGHHIDDGHHGHRIDDGHHGNHIDDTDLGIDDSIQNKTSMIIGIKDQDVAGQNKRAVVICERAESHL